FAASGWHFTLDLTGVSAGPHTIQVLVSSEDRRAGKTCSRAVTMAVAVPTVTIETPSLSATMAGTSQYVNGWAVDTAAASGTGVDQVQIQLDGVLKGSATYDDNRPDIASVFGARFAASGWHFTLDLTGVSAGPHTIQVLV